MQIILIFSLCDQLRQNASPKSKSVFQVRRRVRSSSRRCRWYRQFKILSLFQILLNFKSFLGR